MVCLRLEPGAAFWKMQTNPLSYGGSCKVERSYLKAQIKIRPSLSSICRSSFAFLKKICILPEKVNKWRFSKKKQIYIIKCNSQHQKRWTKTPVYYTSLKRCQDNLAPVNSSRVVKMSSGDKISHSCRDERRIRRTAKAATASVF